MNAERTPLIDRARGLSLLGNDAQLYAAFLSAFPAEPSFAAMLCALEAGEVEGSMAGLAIATAGIISVIAAPYIGYLL